MQFLALFEQHLGLKRRQHTRIVGRLGRFCLHLHCGYNSDMAKKSSNPLRSIQPIVKIVRLGSPKSDYLYWQSQSFDDRLSTLEEIRSEYHRWRGNAQPRLQRVYSITKR
jgi:hypothetical protein